MKTLPRRYLSILGAIICVAALAPAASAEETPPGATTDPAVSQYVEQVPNADGSGSQDGTGSAQQGDEPEAASAAGDETGPGRGILFVVGLGVVTLVALGGLGWRRGLFGR